MEAYRGKKILKLIEKHKNFEGEPKVLDIGCGPNNHFFKFKNYTGMDLNYHDEKINIIEKDLNEDTSLPFEDNSFDVVMATEFLEHLFRPDILAKEINRVAKKDGVIMISLPNEFTINCRVGYALNKVRNEGFDLYSHKYIFNIEKIEEFMHDHFDVLERDLACLGHFWKDLPDSVKDLMTKISPSLFAKSVIYACKPIK